jgi:penicillin-binding protein 1C
MIADDGQWRFPYNSKVSEKFEKAILQFEDRSYYYHFGFNPFSISRAIIQNIKAGKKKSGGSTLTMQVIRLSRQGKPRTIYQKIIEIILSTRLELTYSKKEIIALYASNAPFGGNVVGLDAASWRYFGKNPNELSWAESALLAVLPNAPSLIYPGKNQQKLTDKRNRLLDRLHKVGTIDDETCRLSKQEPLPGKPYPLPEIARHLLVRCYTEGMKGQFVKTTINKHLQKQINEIIERHHQQLKGNEIHNAAALVLDVKTGNALAYIGNTENAEKSGNGNEVDVITAHRSTGSILKPFLFASMLSDGEILPNTLVADIPTQISGYVPQNYNLTYDGAIPAKRALARSLNIPAVRMLQNYGIDKFNYNLKKLGMNSLNNPPDHYGLTIILGGAEGSLWNIAGMYASMSRILNHYYKYNGKYNPKDIHEPAYISHLDSTDISPDQLAEKSFMDAASIKLTFDAMVEVSRPDAESGWQNYSSSFPIAWKTGTSFGFRDGWAIGVTPSYVIAVWVGNANGEGRPGLTGIATAAPIMFDIFSLIQKNEWFEPPYDEMERVPICSQSGYRASDHCTPIDTMWIPLSGLNTPACPYHRIIHLDKTGQYRVTSNCEDVNNMIHTSWFVLPPAQEWYYKSKNPSYKELPPFKEGCTTASNSMELIYPKETTKIYVPIELDGTIGKTIFQVAHRKANTIIYWHLDDKYIGST